MKSSINNYYSDKNRLAFFLSYLWNYWRIH